MKGEGVESSIRFLRMWLEGSLKGHIVKIVDGGLYFIFSFHFYFTFLFLEQLRLGFISHAVTSVTN